MGASTYCISTLLVETGQGGFGDHQVVNPKIAQVVNPKIKTHDCILYIIYVIFLDKLPKL